MEEALIQRQVSALDRRKQAETELDLDKEDLEAGVLEWEARVEAELAGVEVVAEGEVSEEGEEDRDKPLSQQKIKNGEKHERRGEDRRYGTWWLLFLPKMQLRETTFSGNPMSR